MEAAIALSRDRPVRRFEHDGRTRPRVSSRRPEWRAMKAPEQVRGRSGRVEIDNDDQPRRW
jgi:hypothetical protein